MTSPVVLRWQTALVPGVDKEQVTARRIQERTGGGVVVEVHDLNDLVPEFDTMFGVQDGRADIGFTTSGYGSTAGMIPHSAAGELPNWPSGQAGSAFARQVCERYVKKDLEALGVTPIFYELNMADDFGFAVPPYMTDIYSTHEYECLDDLKGARIVVQHRTAADALRLLGMEPVIRPYLEVPGAFARGEIDGSLHTAFHLLWLGDDYADMLRTSVRVGFPQAEDAFMFMNAKVAASMAPEQFSVVKEEMQAYWKSMDRVSLIRVAAQKLQDRVVAGQIRMIELSPQERAWVDGLWDKDLVDMWVDRQVASGLTDARGYWQELKDLGSQIHAEGIPDCEEDYLR